MDIFKPYLNRNTAYKGGKGRKDVLSMTNAKKIYKLSSNENALGPSPKATKAIQDAIAELNEYPDRTDSRLRLALSEFYSNELTADQFFTQNGGVAIIEMICRAFISPGLESIVTNPCFKPYILFTNQCGGKVVDVPLLEPDFKLNVNGVLESINENTRLVFLTSPNNPTGTYIPKLQIDQLVEELPDHVVLVIDEVYYQFVDADDYVRPLHYVKQGKKIIGINSFSKAYGLAGMRVGYAYSTSEMARYVGQLNRPFTLSNLAMEGAIAALQDESFIEETINLVSKERLRVSKALTDRGIKHWDSQSNFIMIKPEMDINDFESRMLEYGVMVRPVAKFGAPGCVRVTIGTEEANDAYLEAIDKVLNLKE